MSSTRTNPQSIAAQDLTAAAAEVASGRRSACTSLAESQAAMSSPACEHAFLRRFDAQAEAAARAADAACAAGAPLPRLAGLAVSIKDLFDVAGMPSTAASRSMADAAPAVHDCPAVARLRAAGAALTGHTSLSEFAFSGVGTNPHHGTPANVATRALDTAPRIPGGSTSGGAVSVAAGAAWAALGSDTGGSIRIPAALQGLVGFKNTQALTPLQGCIPLAPSLDTSCAITRSVRDAVLLHEILAARRVSLAGKPLRARRLALPRGLMLDALDPTVARAFERSLGCLRAAGAQIDEVELVELNEPARMAALGSLPAAESWVWHKARLQQREADYDPRVALRIKRGQSMSAADYLELLRWRADWSARLSAAIASYDAVVTPTLPIVAPPIAPLLASDEQFFATNALLLRNPSIVNMLDGCALSLPCHAAEEMPVGLMLWAASMHDDTVLDIGLAVEAALLGERA